LANDEIVGQMCAIPVDMKIGDRVYHGGWGCDFIVSEKCRGAGIGYRLTKAYDEHFQIGIGLSMADSTRRIWNKFNPIELKPMSIFLFPVKLNANLVHRLASEKLEGHPWACALYLKTRNFFRIDDLASLAINEYARIRRLLNPFFSTNSISTIEQIYGFDNEIDTFSENTHNAYSAIVKRESRLLNWKFFLNRQFNYSVFIARKGRNLRGYVVLRGPHPAEGNIGQIVDFYVAKDDLNTLKELFLFSIKYFGSSISAIRCATSLPSIEKMLRKFGFLRNETIWPLVLVSDPAIRERIKSITDDWFLTLADQDLERVRPV
jgi:hypothetical protein